MQKKNSFKDESNSAGSLAEMRSLVTFFEELTPNPEENINIIVQQVGKALHCAFVLYCVVDEKENMLFVREGYQIPDDFDRIMPGKGHVCFEKKIWRARDPVIIEDLQKTRFLETDPSITKFALKSYIGTGFPLEGNQYGCLCIFDTRTRPFLPSENEKLVILSSVLSLEEKRKRSYKNIKNKLSIEEMLFEISSRAVSGGTLRGFLDYCVEIIGKALDVGGIFVWKYDAETDTVSLVARELAGASAVQLVDSQDFPFVLFPWDLDQVKENKIVQYDDIEELEEGKGKKEMREHNLKSMLMFPLFSKGIFYGTLGIEVYDHPRRWHSNVVDTLTSVSNIMSRSIEGYLVEQQLQRAREDLEEQVKLRTEKLNATLQDLEREHKETLLREAELEDLNQELLEMNKAITVLARNVKREKTSVEKDLSLLISTKVIPLIEDLRKSKNLEARRSELDVIFGYLNEIGVNLAGESCGVMRLTVAEMKVASMINKGFKSHQIANKLNVSLETVKTHRKRIRKKINVQNTAVNLASYLKHFFQTESP